MPCILLQTGVGIIPCTAGEILYGSDKISDQMNQPCPPKGWRLTRIRLPVVTGEFMRFTERYSHYRIDVPRKNLYLCAPIARIPSRIESFAIVASSSCNLRYAPLQTLNRVIAFRHVTRSFLLKFAGDSFARIGTDDLSPRRVDV